MKHHIVSLAQKEKQVLEFILSKGSHPAVVVKRAHILLKADRQLKDTTIAEHLDCTPEHVARIRQRYCTFGLQRAISDAPREGRPVVFHQKEKEPVICLAKRVHEKLRSNNVASYYGALKHHANYKMKREFYWEISDKFL